MRAKGKHFRKTDRNVYSDNHGQIIWDEHVKNNIFKKYITYPSQSRPPPPETMLILELSWQKLRYMWQQHCDRGAGNTSVHTSE